VRRKGVKSIELLDEGLAKVTELPAKAGQDSFELAHRSLVKQSVELDLEAKLAIVRQLAAYPARLDISGGDPLALSENWEVLHEASRRLGRSNVTLTSTGPGIDRSRIDELAELVSEVNVTYAPTVPDDFAGRPLSYDDSNLSLARRMVESGLRVRIEVPLTRAMCTPQNLRRIFEAIQSTQAQTLLLMRLFPVGRGVSLAAEAPTRDQYVSAISLLRTLGEARNSPKIKLQCALRHLEQTSNLSNPCDLATQSFGITPQGDLLLSPWAIGIGGRAISRDWVVGNVLTDSLKVLLESELVARVNKRADHNFGHCKIFAAMNSNSTNFLDRISTSSDPLYSKK
jgi:MoaA/NifB/PqqE/SkfB family radical SAM enzyme